MQPSTSQRVEALRDWMTQHQLDAIIIPHEDEYLGEYVPEHNERLQWLTGFTGSAGAAVITKDKAAIFVDGRYTVQVRKQVPANLFEYRHLVEEPYLEWLLKELPADSKVGFDPKMHRASWLTAAQKTLGGELELSSTATNAVDDLWLDRPAPVVSPMRLMGDELVGTNSATKRKTIADILKKKKADCAILTELDSICWLLNIRGLDVSRLPVLLSHAIIYNDSRVDFFLDPERVANHFDEHVGEGVQVHHPEQLASTIAKLTNKKVIVDPATSNAWFTLSLQNAGAEIINDADPCLMPKAAKNPTEIAGMKACHIRDGAAMVKFLSWLDKQVELGVTLDEAMVSDTLQAFRELDPTLADLSFDTISAAASNAAMCHYNHINQPKPGQLELNTLYLVDSGGQYIDGTTDITRTVAIGNIPQEMKQQYTLVLKGHIALAKARFPKGTCGHHLDVLARQYLWANGYDFDHGTGHGVGHFLSVHEGPQRIGKAVNNFPFEPGMVLSNEPGYYRADGFGIRIENLELVVNVETNGDFNVMGFEALTRCPIDTRAIDTNLLTKPELAWLNDYHQTVWDDVSPLVEGDVKEWLKQATQPLLHND
ncbi:aminopeptidase P family protein [Vibrio nitrifigilis]|uniref:Aminopeptidase P family protein n=1 Tax=Vibrio nitrifigilis TaxID=2789781 RepID=A0ABS0GI48_9VIBR|nr:aminopeptidase P family protein [Vibrio nitrifigilis]MBF9002022.1 aminopeptidase P family protein [Vibrio nitrifigilis]